MGDFHAEEREGRVRGRTAGSLARLERSKRVMPGGVATGVRRAARPYPMFFTHGEGARVWDVDGRGYFDYGLAWGPLMLGHRPPVATAAIRAQLERDLTFGAQHDLEYEVAEMFTSVVPCADQVCFANSGTEIVQVALRLARAVTGRVKYLKFEGHYHGWDDSVLVSYKSSREELEAAGMTPVGTAMGQRPDPVAVVAEWNNEESVRRVFAEYPGAISAVICEPLLANNGCVEAAPGFLEMLRAVTRAEGALLIFDEVITGFRLGLAGAQGVYGVTPDLATYAKAIGAGTALSALGGRREYMDLIADGRVVHAGSLNGNPVSLAAAKAAMEYLADPANEVYPRIERLGARLRSGLEAILRGAGHEVLTQGAAAVFQLAFRREPARNYRETLTSDHRKYSDFALALLDEGVIVLPDGRWYISAAHTEEDIEATLAAAERAVRAPEA
ncbi:MAG: aspartate aminotransferase family protein [Bryobacteraceae bacterium]|nr:aspartate aminotransferase family protein [Solibacteraceae bacterium]MCO5349618.1 aspartate aminotransferase family protein [Bryobacteraceae bacterium]